MKRYKLERIINLIIVILTVVGLVFMFNFNDENNELVSHGVENFKYFTVLSNVFCGIVAFSQLCFDLLLLIRKKQTLGELKNDLNKNVNESQAAIVSFYGRFRVAKLISTTSVALTFATIAFFLWPIYRLPGMYSGSNLFFHLIIPLLAIFDFILLEGEDKIPFKCTFYAAIPSILYAVYYVSNILINGIGEWPHTNDWYGYLNWGVGGGVIIFLMTVLMTWLMACILRLINNKLFINHNKSK